MNGIFSGVGAKQQQVTGYAHKDENNKFLIKKWNEDPPLFYTDDWNKMDVEFVKQGDLVRLEHIMTRRNIHSHQQPAPLSKKQFQVFNYFILPLLKYFVLYECNLVTLTYFIVTPDYWLW